MARRHILLVSPLLSIFFLGCAEPVEEPSATSANPITQQRCQSFDRHDWLQFHDDKECLKMEPSNKGRFLSCPNVATDGTGFSTSRGPLQFDYNVLTGIVDPDIKMTAILIRRINGVPHYHYMSNGTGWERVYPWSTSKFMGVAFAAQSLRQASGGAVGLDASTTSNLGPIPLGDLATLLHTYEPAYHDDYPSNGLARYFFNIANRDSANAMLHGWLGRADESIGANYGANPPNDLGYTFTDPGGVEITTLGADQSGFATSLSTFTMAEMLKRLAMWDDPETRLPNLKSADLETLFYGATDSRIYAGQMGGMSADLSRVVQAAFDMKSIDARSHGRWRNFGKLGQGTSEAGNPLVDVQYACLPVLDSAGNPVPNEGAEFVVSSFIAGGSAQANDERIADNYRRLIHDAILPRTGSGVLAAGSGGTLVTANCTEITGTTSPNRAMSIRVAADPAGGGAVHYATQADPQGSFRLVVPRSLYTGVTYHVLANADRPNGPPLEFSGATIACLPSLQGTLRPLTWDAFLAWKFDLDRDVAPVSEASLVGLPQGSLFAGIPVLVRPSPSLSVFVVESNNFNFKHGVPSMTVLGAWHLDGHTIYDQAPEAVASYPELPVLRPRPELVRTPIGSIYLIE